MVETRSGRRYAVLFFVLAFLALLLGRWVRPVNHAVLTVAAPFNAVLSSATNTIGDVLSGIFDGPQLHQQVNDLQKRNGQLVQQTIAEAAALHENQLLRRMLNFHERNAHLVLVSARVIGTDPNSLADYVLIDHGSSDGLRIGMTVVDQSGFFVGKIVDLTGRASRVQVMLSPSSSVGAVDMRSRATGLVEGKYAQKPLLDTVPSSKDLRQGDLIVTSGQLNLYPRNILLGQVASVDHRNFNIFQTAVIRPAADFGNLELVQVVRNFVPSEPTKLLVGQ